MTSSRLKMVGMFLIVCIFYSAWMTGFTFRFTESSIFPDYNMLANAYAKGRLFIDPSSRASDSVIKNDKQYHYPGPVPALLRLPAVLVLKKGVPTGVMIALFCAGASILFALILGEMIPPEKIESLSHIKTILVITFIFNGFSLLMVTIPIFHNEAISAAMFFLMASIFLLLKIRKRGYRVSACTSVLFGLTLSLTVGSRFSYVFAVVVIGCIFIYGLLKNCDGISGKEITLNISIVTGIGIAAMGMLLWYNYARFGAYFDFGRKYSISLYRDYMVMYGTFRYDNFPYNFWSYFFRIPQFIPEFPFLKLPGYFLKVQSIGPMPYFLINGNELAVSLFYLMPITLFSFMPLFSVRFRSKAIDNGFLIISVLFVVQFAVISLSMAAIARYYYDFLPLMMLMVFIGVAWLKTTGKVSNGLVGLLGAISIAISFALPMNAIRFYDTYINYQSPLLKIFF